MNLDEFNERTMAVESEVTLNAQELMVLVEALSEYVVAVARDNYLPPAFDSKEDQLAFFNSIGIKLTTHLVTSAGIIFHDQDEEDMDLLENTLRDIRDIRGAN